MFASPGCGWCQRFDYEIGNIYPKTEEGRFAPLRRVDIRNASSSEWSLAMQVRYSPTFVLIENGREVGRITGYSGDDMFWAQLTKLTESAKREQ